MAGFPSPFGGTDDGDLFDPYDEFVPENLPDPGPFLDGQEVLVGDAHVAFHRVTRDLFEERGVYDMTFNYNLARLNLDTRHPEAGFRYAREADDPAVLRAEFTPTTPFCPQTTTLTVGAFRAWNGLADRHEYDLVRVRAAPMHHQSEAINDQLAGMEAEYRETGTVEGLRPTPVGKAADDGGRTGGGVGGGRGGGRPTGRGPGAGPTATDSGGDGREDSGPDAPF